MSIFQEFSPIFRVINDYERASRCVPRQHQAPSFKPKFDVKEHEHSYEVLGELPGIEQKDVNIEWADATTLQISGRTEYRARKASSISKEAPAPNTTETESTSEKENDYKPPSVSDEETDDFVAVASQSGEKAAGKKPEQDVAQDPPVQAPEKQQTPATEKAKYWVSERSVGTFHRAFSFPVRVDQELVKASLKNGVLSIVIPKAKIPEPRRINIE